MVPQAMTMAIGTYDPAASPMTTAINATSADGYGLMAAMSACLLQPAGMPGQVLLQQLPPIAVATAVSSCLAGTIAGANPALSCPTIAAGCGGTVGYHIPATHAADGSGSWQLSVPPYSNAGGIMAQLDGADVGTGSQHLPHLQPILCSSTGASPVTVDSLSLASLSSFTAHSSGSSSGSSSGTTRPAVKGSSAPQVRAYHWSPEKRARSVFFARVPPSVSEEEVALVFSSAGNVVELQLFRTFLKCRVSKGCGVLCYETPSEAQKAIQMLNGNRIWPSARHALFVSPVRAAEELPLEDAPGSSADKQGKGARAAPAYNLHCSPNGQVQPICTMLQQMGLSAGGPCGPVGTVGSQLQQAGEFPCTSQPHQLMAPLAPAGVLQQVAGTGSVGVPLASSNGACMVAGVGSSPQVVWGFGGMPAGGSPHVQQMAPGGAQGGAAMGYPGQVAVLVAAPQQLGGSQLPPPPQQQQQQQPMLTVLQGPGGVAMLQPIDELLTLQPGQQVVAMNAPTAATDALMHAGAPTGTTCSVAYVANDGSINSMPAQMANGLSGVQFLQGPHAVAAEAPGLMARVPCMWQPAASMVHVRHAAGLQIPMQQVVGAGQLIPVFQAHPC